jgi:hypothetical protein
MTFDMQQPSQDTLLVSDLLRSWYSTRAWAEELLAESLGLDRPEHVLQAPHRGRHEIPGTDWEYRTHGVGVEITRPGNVGGVDFDFDQLVPDACRLREFLVKQYRFGSLVKKHYGPLLQDTARWQGAVGSVLNQLENDV